MNAYFFFSRIHDVLGVAYLHNVPIHCSSFIVLHSFLPMPPINLDNKLAQFTAHWSPKTVAQFNGHDIMVVKAQGEFVWHQHDETDDLFLVLKGRLTIEMHDGDVTLGPGELFAVPRGVQHRPVAEQEVHLVIIEPMGTPNTGDKSTAVKREEI